MAPPVKRQTGFNPRSRYNIPGVTQKSLDTFNAAPLGSNMGQVRTANSLAKDAGVSYTTALNAVRGQVGGGLPPPVNRPPTSFKPPGSGGGRGGGGGGGGAAGPDPNAMRQAAFMMDLIKSGQFNPAPMTAERDAVAQAKAADMGAVNPAWDNYNSFLNQNQTNPYTNMRATATQVPQDLLNLLASQNVDPTNYSSQVQLGNMAGQQSADAFNRMAQMNAANTTLDQESRRSMGELGRAQAIGNIQGADRGMLAYIQQQERARTDAARQEKLQMLLKLSEVIGAGGLNQPSPEQLAAMGVV